MQTLKHWISTITFRATVVPWIIFFKFFLHWKVVYKDPKVKKIKKGPVLVVMNHVSWMDPFIGGCAIPNVFPIRYLTKGVFFNSPLTGVFVRLYGCLKVKREVKIEDSLKEAVNILQKKRTVGIFPEGKILKNKNTSSTIKPGAGYLAIKTEPTIIPIYIDGLFKIRPHEIFLRKRKACIYVGRAFKLNGKYKNPEDASNFIFNKVNKLKN